MYGTVKLAFVHHSETPNGYGPGQVPSILHSIFAYHRYVRGYFDIAYNFAVDAFGRIWEARAGGIDEAVIGAHAGGYNAESTGVVVLGSFSAATPPPAALGALDAVAGLEARAARSAGARAGAGRWSRPMARPTRRLRPDRTCRCRASPAIATAIRRVAPATRCTHACPRSARAWPG